MQIAENQRQNFRRRQDIIYSGTIIRISEFYLKKHATI
jgi:hypothetical protein